MRVVFLDACLCRYGFKYGTSLESDEEEDGNVKRNEAVEMEQKILIWSE